MGYNEKLADRIRNALGEVTDYEERKMFGGLCFMVHGSMCCGIADEDFMVRVGPDAYGDALAQPHVRPMDFTGRPLKGMVYVGTAGLRTPAALSAWVRRGLDFVATPQARKKAAKRKKATPQR